MTGLLPVALDLRRLKIAAVGAGPRIERRVKLLAEAGAVDLRCFASLPDFADLAGVQLVFVADMEAGAARVFAERVRAAGALVNVEDVTEACDFQSAGVVRRGDLTLGIWTNARVPMLARVLKDWLERLLPADFGRVVDALGRQRDRLRASGTGTLPLEAAATRAVGRLDAPDFRVPPLN
jgi:precorrin-2 dehydrogenase / sirohydrochlorin ferrochelatase